MIETRYKAGIYKNQFISLLLTSIQGGKFMEQKSLEVFGSMPVPKAVFKNALPAMAAMLMVLVYNLADTFFIGQTRNQERSVQIKHFMIE